MKRICNILLTLTIFVIPFITNINIVDAKILNYGDVSEDGLINTGDSSIVNFYVNSGTELKPIQLKLADRNNDGKVDDLDLKLIAANNQLGQLLTDKIKDTNIKEGNYIPVYDETCKAGYGEVEKCITKYVFSNLESGLYKGTDDDGTTYFYRNNIQTNYVSFANMLWRIVRINGDGSIRLISDFNIGKQGYGLTEQGYGPTADTRTGAINKSKEWYDEKLKSYDKYIETGKFTYFTSENFSNDDLYTNNNPAPSFLETGRGVYNGKIGILSIDELRFSGEGNSYLDVYDSNGWILGGEYKSPSGPYGESNSQVYLAEASENGYKNYKYHYVDKCTEVGDCQIVQNNTYDIRSVINLKSDITIAMGDGRKDNPYVIDTFSKENRPVVMNNIDANTTNIILSDKLNNAKENKETLTYETYNTATNSGDGKYLYTWKIDADNITTTKDINTVIDINKLKETDNQTYSKIKTVIKKDDADVKYLTFTEDGNIGSTATITVDVSDMGSNVSVYKWDNRTNTILVVNPNQTIEDGKVSFDVSDNTNTKNYFITKGVLSESIVGNPNTGMMMFYIIGGISVLLIIGITYLIYFKKNNKFLKA